MKKIFQAMFVFLLVKCSVALLTKAHMEHLRHQAVSDITQTGYLKKAELRAHCIKLVTGKALILAEHPRAEKAKRICEEELIEI